MQAASPAAPKRRLRQRARLLVQGIDAAPAAEQTETGFDAGRVAPRLQTDRQSAVIVDAASPAKANMQWIKWAAESGQEETSRSACAVRQLLPTTQRKFTGSPVRRQ